MKRLIALLSLLLLPTLAQASGLQASFTGSNLNGLTRSTTMLEVDSAVTPANYLVDKSGRGHNLAPTSDPGGAITPLQGPDGRKYVARAFDGSADYYSVAHHADFNIFDGNHTITAVIAPNSAGADSDEILSHYGASNGFILTVNSSGYASAIYYNSASVPTYSLIAAATSIRDSRYHVVQVVRSSNYVTLYQDGVASAPVDVTGYGTDGSFVLAIGTNSTPTEYFYGNILYTRLDAEALSLDRLNYERNQIMGTGVRSGTADIGYDFSRASTAYMTYSDGSIGQHGSGMVRTGGDGGGVLIEGGVSQLLTYTGAFSTNWTKTRCSISATSVVLPDGSTGTTNTLKESDDAATTHPIAQSFTSAIGTSYVESIYVKYNGSAAIPREWIYLYIADGAKSSWANFNIRYGYTGTVGGTLSAKGRGITALKDGWYRIHVWGTAETASAAASYNINITEGDNDVTINVVNPGGQDSYFIAFPQLEIGTFPTSYIPRLDGTAASRSADSLTIRPYSIGKGMQLGSERMWVDFSQDATAAMITTNKGGYTLTKGGTIVRKNEYANSEYYHYFNGTDSKYSVASADFNPAGDFSVVAVFTPTSVTGTHVIAGKYTATSDQRGRLLYQTDDDVGVSRTTNGQAGTLLAANLNNCLVIGKPVLVTATYSTAGGLWIKVDAFTAGTNAGATGVVHPSTYDFVIGDHGTGAKFAGNMHYVSFIDGIVTEAQHNNLYFMFKQANILPVKIGTSYDNKKLYVEFDAKCPYTGNGDYTTGAIFLDISGNIGASDSNTNRLSIYGSGTSIRASLYPNGENTERYMSSVVTTRNVWHRYKFYFDFAALGNSTGYVDTTLFTNDATLTGAKDLDTSDTFIRIGQDYAGTVNNYCATKNLRIRSAP